MLVVKMYILLLRILPHQRVCPSASGASAPGGNFKRIIRSDILTIDTLRAVEREAGARGYTSRAPLFD